MRGLIFLIGVLVVAMGGQARASGDVGCTPSLQAFHSDFSGCENMALIAPSNDTRVNLTLLLLDLHNKVGDGMNLPPFVQYSDWPNSDWAWPVDWQHFAALFAAAPPPLPDGSETQGEGTICISDSGGADGFTKAVAAESTLDAAEKQALSEARKAVHCVADAAQGAAPTELNLHVQSPAALEFAAYLAAVNKFYATDHNDPSGFTPLKTATQPWVKEAAIYMEARVKLLAALQSGLSDYGDVDLKKADKAAAMAAGEGLKAYIAAYPQGSYVNSARGLLRRAFWLSEDTAQQLAAYNAQINLAPEAVQGLADYALAQEIDAKLPEEAYRDPKSDPLLVAIELLRKMRPVAADGGSDSLKPADIEAVKDVFKDKPDLYLYLQAAQAFFVAKDMKAVLALLPEQKLPEKLNYLQYSTAMLRVAASGDAAAYVPIINAAGSPLQQAHAEMAWALAQEKADKLDAVFAPDSPVTSALIRTRLFENAAGAGLLRRQSINAKVDPTERALALYVLLYRDLTQGAFKAFGEDVKLISPAVAKPPAEDDTYFGKLGLKPPLSDYLWDGRGEGFECPALAAIAAKLAASPKDSHAKLCLGEFLRLKIGDEFSLASSPPAGELGGGGLKFGGKSFTRHEAYIQVMADPKTSADDKAFALYRAIECYASVGNNHCGGKDVDKSVRKGWFTRLKKEFGKTKWADEAQYYY